jgi:hypothetical protein
MEVIRWAFSGSCNRDGMSDSIIKYYLCADFGTDVTTIVRQGIQL